MMTINSMDHSMVCILIWKRERDTQNTSFEICLESDPIAVK
jgi:hypothetical protein